MRITQVLEEQQASHADGVWFVAGETPIMLGLYLASLSLQWLDQSASRVLPRVLGLLCMLGLFCAQGLVCARAEACQAWSV